MRKLLDRQSVSKKWLFVASIFLASAVFAILAARNIAAQTFVGPTQSAGVGTGAIGINSSNNISLGTSTPIADTKLFIVASSTASSGFALQVVQPVTTTTNDSSYTNLRPLFVIRNDAAIGIGGPIAAAPGNNVVIHGPNVRVLGTLTADAFSGPLSGTLAAGNVSAGAFGANTGGGNYSFPAALSIGTSTAPAGGTSIYTTGNVGIGTASPGSILDVRSTTSNHADFGYAGAGNATHEIRWDSSKFYVDADYGNTNSGSGLFLGVDGTTRIMIGASGNVAIATTTDPSYPLTVAGTIASLSGGFRFPDGTTQTTAATGSGGGSVSTSSPITANYVPYWTNTTGGLNGTSTIYIDTSGNVGIGTSTPASALEVVGTPRVSNSGQGMVFRITGGSYTNWNIGAQIHVGGFEFTPSTAGGGTTFSTPSMVILNTGNVGIGTASPGDLLEVSKNGSGGIRISNTSSSVAVEYEVNNNGTADTGTRSNHPLTFITNNTERVRIDTSGNVGIGTTPSYKLDVAGTYHVTGASTLDSSLTFTQGASTRNVGIIGTYSPNSLAAIWSMGASYQLGANGTAGTLYGLNYSYEPDYGGAGNNPGAIAGLGHQMQWRAAGVTQTAIGTGVYTVGTITAPIYAGQVSGSSYGGIKVSGTTGGYSGIYLSSSAGTVTGMYDASGNGGDWDPTTGWHFYWNRANTSLGIGGSTTSASYRAYVNGSLYASSDVYAANILYGAASVRAPIFYDLNNTGYYVDPASTSNVNYLTVNGSGVGAFMVGETSVGSDPVIAEFYSSCGAGCNAPMGVYRAGTSGCGGCSLIIFYSDVFGTRTSAGQINANGTLSSTSDSRRKKNIVYMDSSALDIVDRLKPATYNSVGGSTQLESGFIAQDVQRVLPSLVTEEPDGYLSLNYSGVIPFAVKSIQVLDEKISSLASNFLAEIGGTIKDGVLHLAQLVVDRLQVRTLQADKVISSSLEMKDSATGEVYCVTLRNGEFLKTAGACSN